jgi:cell division transport system permease protein
MGMLSRHVRYAFAEALTGLASGWRSAGLAVVTIGGAVFVLGALLVASAALQRVADAWRDAATMAVYVAPDLAAEDRKRIGAALAASPVVRAQQYVTPEQAAARFSEAFPDLAPALASFDRSPFPPSFDVELRASATAERDVAALVRTVSGLRGVTEVRYASGLVDRLARITSAVRAVGGGLVVVLALAAAIVIISVVRLSYVARRDEIDVLLLVGAPFASIRGPFLAEGALQGAIGAALGVGALALAYAALRQRIGASFGTALGVDAVAFLSPATIAVVLVTSAMFGAVAALVAIGRPALSAD